MDKKSIIRFFSSFGRTLVIGLVLILSSIFVLYILNYFLPSGGLDPSIFLIAILTGWCTICFKLWIDFIRGKTIKEKVISAVIYLIIFTWLGIVVIFIVSSQPVLNIYLVKALFSWYFGSIIGILYEVVKPKKTKLVND